MIDGTTDEMWDGNGEDAMTYNGQQVALTCVKCRQTGERIVVYCGPTQRAWNYDDVPSPAAGNRIRFGRFIWRAKEQSLENKQCQLDGEHFHLHCTHCQYKWIEPLGSPPSIGDPASG